MSVGPGGPGGSGGPGKPEEPMPSRGPMPDEKSSGPIEAMIKRRQLEDKMRAEADAIRKAEMKKKIIKYGGPAAIATAVIFAALSTWAWYKQSREGCGATDDRRRAVKVVMQQGDSTTGLIGSRFPDRKQFRCVELSDPKGILIAVKEDTGDPIVWFVDQAGTPLNVNLLAASWTPRLGAGPEVDSVTIAKVTQ